MLGRISEINVETKFKRSQKQVSQRFLNKMYGEHKEIDQDSLSISPALQIAAKFKLRIKDVLKESGNKFEVKFELDNYLFEVKIDLEKLYDVGRVYLNGYYNMDKLGEPVTLLFWVKYTLDSIDNINSLELETKYIDEFLERVLDINSNSNLNIYDQASLESLINGLETELNSEFYGLVCFGILFIQKFYEIKFSEKFGNDDGNERVFSLQLVKQIKG